MHPTMGIVMRHFRTHRRLYAPLAAVLMALFLQACTRWAPAPLEPAHLPAADQARVTLRTGQRVIVKSPVISGDTLTGTVPAGVVWSRPRPIPGIPLSQINTFEVRKVDAGATVGVVVLTAVAVAGVALWALAKSIRLGGGNWGCLGMCHP